MPRAKKTAAESKAERAPAPANPCGGDCQGDCVGWYELEGYSQADLRTSLSLGVGFSDTSRPRTTAFKLLGALKLCADHNRRRSALLMRAS